MESKDYTSGFKIIGIPARTTNQNSQDIARLWERFFQEKISEKIPNSLSTDIIVVYTDYTGDFNGQYTVVLGMVVSQLDQLPEGLAGREFPAENFIRYKVKGEMPKSMIETWKNIWQHDKELHRKYTYDFEVYGINSENGNLSEAEIYLGVHPQC